MYSITLYNNGINTCEFSSTYGEEQRDFEEDEPPRKKAKGERQEEDFSEGLGSHFSEERHEPSASHFEAPCLVRSSKQKRGSCTAGAVYPRYAGATQGRYQPPSCWSLFGVASLNPILNLGLLRCRFWEESRSQFQTWGLPNDEFPDWVDALSAEGRCDSNRLGDPTSQCTWCSQTEVGQEAQQHTWGTAVWWSPQAIKIYGCCEPFDVWVLDKSDMRSRPWVLFTTETEDRGLLALVAKPMCQVVIGEVTGDLHLSGHGSIDQRSYRVVEFKYVCAEAIQGASALHSWATKFSEDHNGCQVSQAFLQYLRPNVRRGVLQRLVGNYRAYSFGRVQGSKTDYFSESANRRCDHAPSYQKRTTVPEGEQSGSNLSIQLFSDRSVPQGVDNGYGFLSSSSDCY